MQYTVVHSKDPYLLARLATDLQMEGYGFRDLFNDCPFNEFTEWMMINRPDWRGKTFDLFMIPGYSFNPIRHELTTRNYIKVLTQILEP